MDSLSERRIDMGSRALKFSVEHPDSEPGMVTAAARLEQLVTRAREAATAQREGLVRFHTASAEKEKLRREMLEIHIRHLADVGREAAREEPELGKVFRFRPDATTYFAFRTAARSMANAAQEHRELLVKYGLSESVLDEFVQKLDQLDEAVVMGYEGRAEHVGATRILQAASGGIVRQVRVMNGRYRQRFAQDEQALGSWISASRVLKTRQADTPTEEEAPTGTTPQDGTPEGGEARPAS